MTASKEARKNRGQEDLLPGRQEGRKTGRNENIKINRIEDIKAGGRR